eukprot:gb/GECG01014941.1/.p1 GENE.gb/GECG01014941.1/~~gb/GECG01014941.1/.p1  ORF type:complete len:166 (+),score=20.30 gb/GECG01014941.1/:1-498(+)
MPTLRANATSVVLRALGDCRTRLQRVRIHTSGNDEDKSTDEEVNNSLANFIGGEGSIVESLVLDISGRFRSDGAKAIARSLPYNHSLQHLSLSKQGLGNEGASEIAMTLPECNLKVLNLSQNSIGEEGARFLAQALEIIARWLNFHFRRIGLRMEVVKPLQRLSK